MSSTSTETATILINDFGLKGKTFPVFKVDELNVWLLIPHEIASKLILEANSHILASNGVAVRFPNWGIDTGDKKRLFLKNQKMKSISKLAIAFVTLMVW
jgi:hypothetical protein